MSPSTPSKVCQNDKFFLKFSLRFLPGLGSTNDVESKIIKTTSIPDMSDLATTIPFVAEVSSNYLQDNNITPPQNINDVGRKISATTYLSGVSDLATSISSVTAISPDFLQDNDITTRQNIDDLGSKISTTMALPDLSDLSTTTSDNNFNNN